MNLRVLDGVAQVRRPTQRALAKQRTREKILAAAKTLFTARGYEKATIRDIASAAGMSTGAVFASFTDKLDLFNEIIGADREALFESMRQAATGADTSEALLSMFGRAYVLHLGDLPLTQATISASWSPELGAQIRGRLGRRPITALIQEVLQKGIDKGELNPDLDLALVAQMLWDDYTSSLRNAAFDGWGLEDLNRRLKDRIEIILGGVRAA